MWNHYQKRSAVYHINNIKNLTLSVTIQQINSLLKVPHFEVKSFRDNAIEYKNDCETETSTNKEDDNLKVVKIKWQEKLFSPYEIEFYKDIENCTTDTHKKYHQLIVQENLMNESLINNKLNIFTYVDEDNFKPKEKYFDGFIEETNSSRFILREQTTGNEMLMFIYVSLNPDTLLMSLTWNPDKKLLIIYPDFNSLKKNPYFIEIDSDYRHMYSYSIENISKTKEYSYNEALELPPITTWEEDFSSQFDIPPKRSTRISILLQIELGEHFEYDNIHVRYYIRLPNRSKIEDGQLAGSTQSSKCVNNLWVFGHCYQLVLLCEDDFKFEKSISILFEVISIDAQDRERLEGYTNLKIPITVGNISCDLQCIRPDEGLLGQISRYFIGGRTKFDVDNFYNNNCEDEIEFLNRFCSKTKSNGTLKVSYQSIIQRGPELLTRASSKRKSTGMTLTDIMKAYNEARKRLEATALDTEN